MAGETGAPGLLHLHFDVTQGSATGGGPQVDPYDLYTSRGAYPDPNGTNGNLSGTNHLWTTNPPSYPDSTAPAITFGPAPQTNRWYNTNEQVNWTVSDGGSGVYGYKQAWNVDPNSEEFPGANGWLDLADAGEGWHTVNVRA